jgi:hypothetical protein
MSQPIITHLASCPSDHGSPVMKSTKILVHSFDGMERSLRIPDGCCYKFELHCQVQQVQMYLAMSLCNPNQINSQVTISNVLA